MCVKPIVRIVSRPRLDWNTCAGALVSHVSSLCFHCERSSLNPRPSPPSQPPVQDTCRQITLLPAFTAPCPSFSFTYLLFFLHTLDNDDPHLTAAVRHQYAPNSVLISFSSFLLTFFVHFSDHPVQRQPVYPILNKHCTLFTTS